MNYFFVLFSPNRIGYMKHTNELGTIIQNENKSKLSTLLLSVCLTRKILSAHKKIII